MVTLTATSLQSLQTIGSVSTTSGRSSINLGPANQSIVSSAAFAQYASPQINDVLQHVPNVTIQHLAGTGPSTSIVVGGLQPYETQVLIDGHPVATGQYGVFLTEFYPSFLIGGAEVETGPGNTTPFANLAVGGTINLETPGFTTKPTVSFTSGTDNYGSLNNALIPSGSLGHLQLVLAAGSSWNNSPWSNKSACDVYEFDPATTPGTPNSAGVVPFCGVVGGSLYTRGALYKAKYDFSPSTSLQVSVTSTTGGYDTQGYTAGIDYGPTLVEGCIPGSLECTSPTSQNLVGKTIDGIYWYPGTVVWSLNQIYSAEFRTSIGNDTVLARPYIANIIPEIFDGLAGGENTYPAFFGPDASYPACTSLTPTATCYPGPPSLAPGQQIPSTGLTNPRSCPRAWCMRAVAP